MLIANIAGKVPNPKAAMVDAACTASDCNVAMSNTVNTAPQGIQPQIMPKSSARGAVRTGMSLRPNGANLAHSRAPMPDTGIGRRRRIASAAKSSAAVYVSALTREDWRGNCDQSLTDGAVHLRPGNWYRRRLRRHFRYMGLGVWLRRNATAILWDMERP